MDRNETKEIVIMIHCLYSNSFKIETQEQLTSLIDTWHFALEDYDYGLVKATLKNYVRDNHYPPKVKDLTKGLSNEHRSVVPGLEETRALLKTYEVHNTPEEEQRIKEKQAELRRKLGIDR